MKFSVIHPTARLDPEGQFPWWEAHDSALEHCDSPWEVEYILVIHESRAAMFTVGRRSTWGRFTVVVNRGRDSLVDQCNAGLMVASGEIHVWNQDDLLFPEHWDTKIKALIPDTSRKVCIQANTPGAREDLLTLPSILTKALARAIGLGPPDYESMYSDDEWSNRARAFGEIRKAQLGFQHLHWSNGTAQMDEVYSQENRQQAYATGREVFERRMKAGFPRVPFPDETPEEKQPSRLKSFLEGAARLMNPPPDIPPRRSVVVCLPGEQFSMDWVVQMISIQNKLASIGFNFEGMFGHSSVGPDVTRNDMVRQVLHDWGGNRNAPYVLWIDDDNLVPLDLLERWIAHLDSHPQDDVLVGWCWIQRGPQWRVSVATFDEDSTGDWMSLQDLYSHGMQIHRVPRLASGFPCVLMRREVLEQLGNGCFSRISNEHDARGFLGEDFSFFHRCMEAAINVCLDPLGKVAHMKTLPQEPVLDFKQVENAEAAEAGRKWMQASHGIVEAPAEAKM